jgi:hypothetical protein
MGESEWWAGGNITPMMKKPMPPRCPPPATLTRKPVVPQSKAGSSNDMPAPAAASPRLDAATGLPAKARPKSSRQKSSEQAEVGRSQVEVKPNSASQSSGPHTLVYYGCELFNGSEMKSYRCQGNQPDVHTSGERVKTV